MNLAATMSLNTSGFTNPLAGARSAFANFSNILKGALAPLAAIAGVGLTVGAIFEGMKGAFDLGGELTDLAARTGEAIDKLVVFRQALQDSGVGAASAGQLISLMQKALSGVNDEGQPTVDAFAKIGVSLDDLKQKSPVAQITTIGEAIGKIQDPALQTAMAMQIFGRSGAEMKQFFADPAAMATAARSLGAMPALLAKNAGLFDSISDALGRVKDKGKGLFVGIADQLAGTIAPMVEALDSIDLTKVGQEIGSAVNVGLDVLQSGKLGELLVLNFEKGSMELANGMLGAVSGFASAWGTHMAVVAQQWQALFANLSSVWIGMRDGMIGAIQAAGAVLLEVFQKPIIALQAGIEFAIQEMINKLPKGFQKLIGFEGGVGKESYEQISERRKAEGGTLFGASATDLAGKANENFASASGEFDKLSKAIDFKGGARQVLDAFREGFQNGKLIDTSAVTEQLDSLYASFAPTRDAVDSAGLNSKEGKAANKAISGGSKVGKTPDMEADRFTKIGLLFGGGGPAADHARRTADNTAKTVQKLTVIAERLRPGLNETPALAWGA